MGERGEKGERDRWKIVGPLGVYNCEEDDDEKDEEDDYGGDEDDEDDDEVAEEGEEDAHGYET